MNILIINGPNLNLLGKREPSIYGKSSFKEYLPRLKSEFPDTRIDYFQSNHEGEIIDKIHEADGNYHGIVLNAAAYTHTSIAIADAVAAVSVPVVEVHISNIYKREAFRHLSYIAANCIGSISGFGLKSYRLAVMSLVNW
ncbi:MAG: type II 3-dehydroquinate dehydratase [Bacteroidetes bacterium 4572_117]|nr:MAG: type II 3-dehydroquinate dehydratase [Bacteroidetes bacterium 4572_117]